MCNDFNYIIYNKDGKFFWSKADQGLILSSYYYGYIITQVLNKFHIVKIRLILLKNDCFSILAVYCRFDLADA